MVDSKAAKRYSRALFELALEKQTVETVEGDLRHVAESIAQTPEFLLVMRQPKISDGDKKSVVRRAFGDAVSNVVLDFLCFLIDKRRIFLITAIVDDFISQVNAWRGLLIAEVTTAVPMTDQELELFVNRLGQLTGKKIQLVTRLDQSLIGGARIHLGGKLIDGTVATHLERIRERLKKVRVV